MSLLYKYLTTCAIIAPLFTLNAVNICKVERYNGEITNMLFVEKSTFILLSVIASPIITPMYIYEHLYNLEISLRKENINNYIDSKNPNKIFNFKIIEK